LRIMQINIDNGRPEYECTVFGTLFALNSALSGLLLENLNFAAYNHDYTIENIIASWDNAGGSGYYYPLIDHGNYSTNKHDWQYRTFRPALYVKEYIDKMVFGAGFRYDSDLFDTDRFKKLIIPFNQKKLTTISDNLLDLENIDYNISIPNSSIAPVVWQDVTLSSAFSGSADTYFTFENTDDLTITISFSIEVTATNNGEDSFFVEFYKNDVRIYDRNSGTTIGEGFSDDIVVTLSQDDEIYFSATVGTEGTIIDANMSAISASSAGQQVDITLGTPIVLNDLIPKNIRQIDFLVSIVKLFNLYVYEDKFDDTLIYFKPYIDFYGTDNSDSIDWTYKLDRNSVVNIVPMSR